jgi:hypothetical protein
MLVVPGGPQELPVGATVDIPLRLVGLSESERVGALNIEIPTNNPGFEVLGATISDEISSLFFAKTVKFRPGVANDLFVSIFTMAEAAYLTSDIDFGTVTVRGIEPGARVTLNPASSIAALVDGAVRGVNLGGMVIAGDPAPDPGAGAPPTPVGAGAPTPPNELPVEGVPVGPDGEVLILLEEFWEYGGVILAEGTEFSPADFVPAEAVPEPRSAVLLTLALVALFIGRRALRPA